ncbi:F-box/kelch-repeat protein At3g23880-like [Solanum dulcamara]|uniref:F-box/kelch-repeat protein At3g23880-like n=1 Tax=Solanum dulcamara TaxID=45834 RepID=UPI00248514A3|nr:F-box/kelch-repeat protein At3g23880-like [Solanum dulcamara]
MEETSEGSSILPQELIFEIFLRLPVKSLLKFRCVSKSWLFLLSNPLFSKTHVDFCSKTPKFTDYRLAVVSSVSGLGRICHFYNMGFDNSCLNVAKHTCPAESLDLSARILGSCNGLICVTSNSFTLTVLNPCTGMFNVFPDSMLRNNGRGGGGGGCYIRYGFGYDVSVEDYKVVKIFSIPQIEGRYENMVNVYSLKAKSWKMIEGFNSGNLNGKVGVYVNGALHWEVRHSHYSGGFWEIVTLNLAAERYGTIALPSYEDEGVYWTLGVSRGYLVGCCNYEQNKGDVWVMKEYGVEKSWTKVVTISLPVDRWAYILPLFVAENCDEFLLQLGEELALYNSRDGSFTRLDGYTSGGGFRQVQAVTYFESLASPHIK